MVATTTNEDLFKRSKKFFEQGDINNSLDSYEKAITYLDIAKGESQYVEFLNTILEHCRQKNLIEQEAVTLRALGRTYSLFKKFVDSLNFHKDSLKIQRKLGRKLETAVGLTLMAEDLEASQAYEESIKTFKSAAELYHELGKLAKEQDIQIEIRRLEEFSKQIQTDEFYLNKFKIKGKKYRHLL